jgi:hypothetical protein
MRLALVKLQKKVDFSWVEVDVDRDTRLIRQFDTLVPVLEFEGEEVCHYFIDEPAIIKCLSNSP